VHHSLSNISRSPKKNFIESNISKINLKSLFNAKNDLDLVRVFDDQEWKNPADDAVMGLVIDFEAKTMVIRAKQIEKRFDIPNTQRVLSKFQWSIQKIVDHLYAQDGQFFFADPEQVKKEMYKLSSIDSDLFSSKNT
jgi:hypothetical protein